MTFVEKYSAPDYIVSDDNRKLIVLADKGEQREYIGVNTMRQRMVVYRVDDGIVTSKEQNKCDFAFWTERNDVYFIELKGGDYSKALQQIQKSIEDLIDRANVDVNKVLARIVLSTGRSVRANVANTHEVKLIKFLRKFEGTLMKQSGRIKENI